MRGMKTGDNTVNTNKWYFKCEMHVSSEIFHLSLGSPFIFPSFFFHNFPVSALNVRDLALYPR